MMQTCTHCGNRANTHQSTTCTCGACGRPMSQQVKEVGKVAEDFKERTKLSMWFAHPRAMVGYNRCIVFKETEEKFTINGKPVFVDNEGMMYQVN